MAKCVANLRLKSLKMWKKDKKSKTCQHLHNQKECFSSFNSDCFSVSYYTPT